MITENEARFLYRLTNRDFTGRGAIAEVGTWMGRSTVHLAAGLRDAGRSDRIRCFDHYRWAGGANWQARLGASRERGSDFMPDFERYTHPLRNHIDSRRCKIADLAFDFGPVEILVVDAPKRLKDISALLQKFGPHAIPGVTVMAWQDFMHTASSEIPACLSHLMDKLEPIAPVETGSMVALRVVKAWQPEDVTVERLDFHDWSVRRAEAEWAAWRPFVPAHLRPSFHSGLAMILHDMDKIDAAIAVLDKTKDDELVRQRWERFQRTSLLDRYAPLFGHLVAVGAIGGSTSAGDGSPAKKGDDSDDAVSGDTANATIAEATSGRSIRL